LVECAILRGLTNLQTLHLAWRTSRIVVDLAPALERLTALRELVVGDLDIDCAGLAEVLQRVSPGLRTLKLRRTKDHRWSHKGIDDAVALGIARLTNLCELDLTYSYMGPDGAAALAPALRLLLGLRSLDLALNCLGKGGAEAIAPALSRLTALTSLSFYKNDLGPDGVAALAPAISQCHGLAMIDLRLNIIGAYGTTVLAGAVRGWPTMERTLLFNGNEVHQSDESIMELEGRGFQVVL
jgi:Ran GTPase-activating protein (RanGAP) involved in mRNA processing and transport